MILLRPTEISDLDILFQFQLDEQGGYMAAFMPKDHDDRDAFIRKFTRLLQDPSVHNRTILLDDVIVGSIAKFVMDGHAEITYWIDRAYWGKGIATGALKQFLQLETTRPIFGRVACDNFGSQKVLEKNGFVKVAEDSGFAQARQEVIVEYVYTLPA